MLPTVGIEAPGELEGGAKLHPQAGGDNTAP
jgi:hypothetical protein